MHSKKSPAIAAPPSRDPAVRFDRYVERTDGCWIWRGPVNSTTRRYGRFMVNGKQVLAHRWSYEHFVGAIPDDHEIDHLCRNHSCVRPDHLQVVRHVVNIQRGESPSAIHGRKSHCPKGHPYDVLVRDGKRTKRACSICRRASAQRQLDKVRSGVGKGGRHAAKTHCPRGHAYDAENTYLHPKTGGRQCRACRAAARIRSRTKD